jgi:hypothetical protein
VPDHPYCPVIVARSGATLEDVFLELTGREYRA